MFARQAHVPAHDLICIPPTWPFACWGLDQVGPLKKSKGRFEYIFVAINKFTKWIEYKPLVKYSASKAVEFIQDIMHHFGIPNCIITDLGSPFTAIELRNWAQDCVISIDYALVAHPEANRQVERANGLILAGLKPRLYEELEDYGSKWIEELPIVYGLHTQLSRATGYPPFFPSIWIRSRATSRLDLDIPKNRTIRGGRSRTHPKIGTRQYRRSQSKRYPPVSSIPPRFKAPLQQKYLATLISSHRPSTMKNTKN
jgi:hypothetical protein